MRIATSWIESCDALVTIESKIPDLTRVADDVRRLSLVFQSESPDLDCYAGRK